MKRLWLVLVCLGYAWPAWAACTAGPEAGHWTVASPPTWANVKACTDLAASGDTVDIPPGDEIWTQNLNLSGRVINLVGAGRDSDPALNTIIRDGVPRTSHLLDIGGPALNWADSGAHLFESCARLAHIRFTNTPTLTTNNNQALILPSNCIRFDNLTFDHIYGPMIRTYGAVGVIADGTMTTTRHGPMLFINNVAYKGVGSHGDNSWTVNTDAGTGNFLYLERMVLEHSNEADGVLDLEAGGGGGGRVVVRNSELRNGAGLVTHPTGHGPVDRGGRHIESYRNIYFYSATLKATAANFITSGTLLLVLNTYTGFTNPVYLTNWRAVDDTATWRTAAGHGPWDVNGATLETGTITTGGSAPGTAGGTFTVTDAGKAWGTDTLAGRRFWDVTQNWGTKIVSNTDTTLTLGNCARYSCSGTYTAAVGDAYEINPGPYPTLDQVGWASVTGTTVALSAGTGPPGWINEVLQPVYAVANTYTNVTNRINSDDGTVFHNNVDFYYEVSPFTGAAGTGSGPIGSRPGTCTTGVAYWATDQGNWDTEKAADTSGKLYVCTATNTWTARWGDNVTGEPYTYPHPLITGGSGPTPPPSAPTGFEIVP